MKILFKYILLFLTCFLNVQGAQLDQQSINKSLKIKEICYDAVDKIIKKSLEMQAMEKELKKTTDQQQNKKTFNTTTQLINLVKDSKDLSTFLKNYIKFNQQLFESSTVKY